MNKEAGTFNLLDEAWIPILRLDGSVGRVGIREALLRAGHIRQIAASNPLDRVAILRFLLAVLMWCMDGPDSSLAALDEKSTGVPEDRLAKLDEHRPRFELLGDGPRFFQDSSVRGQRTRPVADLLVEFPGADSVNHMRHVVHDGSYGFCPACCALGMLRLSVWASANRYYPASVNPGSAAYAIVEKGNLLLTLRANLPEAATHDDQAPWLCEAEPTTPGAIAKLAWRPRKLWLNAGDSHGACANCGRFGLLVTSVYNEGGWQTPMTEGQRFSKAVETEFNKLGYSAGDNTVKKIVSSAPVIRQCRMRELRETCSRLAPPPEGAAAMPGSAAEEIALLFHCLIARDNAASKEAIDALTKKPNEQEQAALGPADTQKKKFWDADPHLLRDVEAISLPGLGADAAAHSSRFWRDALRLQQGQAGKVTAIGPVVNEFTFQDAVSVALPDASARNQAALSARCSDELRKLLKKLTPNPERPHSELRAAVVMLTPDAEARIRDSLAGLSASSSQTGADDEAFLREAYVPMVRTVVASVTSGSPLRRREAIQKAVDALDKTLSDLARGQPPPSSSRSGADTSAFAEGDAQDDAD